MHAHSDFLRDLRLMEEGFVDADNSITSLDGNIIIVIAQSLNCFPFKLYQTKTIFGIETQYSNTILET